MTSEQERGAARVLEAVRQFVAAWEQHNRFIPRTEGPEELAARKAASAALGVLEGRAQWLETEMELENRGDY